MQAVAIYVSTAVLPSGQLAIGVVMRDAEGRTVSVATRVLGSVSRDEAAYRALLLGLWRAKRVGVQRIRVYADHRDVVDQVQGHREVPPPLVGLYLQVRAMLNAYRWRTLEAIERPQNAEAALAAMEALDRPPARDDLDSLPLWRAREDVLV
jgi:ribonuclease HI